MTSTITIDIESILTAKYAEIESMLHNAMQNGIDVSIGKWFFTRTAYGWTAYKSGVKINEGYTTSQLADKLFRMSQNTMAERKAQQHYAQQYIPTPPPVRPIMPPSRPLPARPLLGDNRDLYEDALNVLRQLGSATKYLR